MLGLKTGFVRVENKQQRNHGESNPPTPQVSWIPSKCWTVWLSEDLRISQVCPWGIVVGFLHFHEQHSKQSDVSLAAGGTGSWVLLKRTKRLFNCRSDSRKHLQIIIHITWVETRDGREILRWCMWSSLISRFRPSGGRSKQRITFQPLWLQCRWEAIRVGGWHSSVASHYCTHQEIASLTYSLQYCSQYFAFLCSDSCACLFQGAIN